MRILFLGAAATWLTLAATVPAQQAAATTQPLEAGAPAPDFTLPGATRYGVLKNPLRLSDFRGKAVVLAFFYRARTRG
jgi:hypothetical protein